jgi:ketosteroid isomerase-like protein
MKRHFMMGFVLAVAVLTSASCQAQNGKAKEARREKLLAARNAVYDAYLRGDVEALDKGEAKEFMVVFPDGMESKEQQIRGIRRAVAARRWPQGRSQVTKEMQIRFEANVAVLTGLQSIQGRGGNSAPDDWNVITEVWVERGGKWMLYHLHYHPLKPEKPK